MDGLSLLTETTPTRATEASVPPCPRCGEPAAGLAPFRSELLGPLPLARCSRCGIRYFVEAGGGRFLLSCDDCGLPYQVDEAPVEGERQRCPSCRSGRMPEGLDAGPVAEATEREIRLALEREWTFVGHEALSVYLERLTRELVRQVPGAPPHARIALFEDASLRTLALPSGTILLSVGTLATVHDEAELAFVVAHDLAHVASGDSSARLVRLGLEEVSRTEHDTEGRGWFRAAGDLIALGFGRLREREADRVALEAVLALGYDPGSVRAYLARVERMVEDGDGRVAELAMAHNPSCERLRALDGRLAQATEVPQGRRVNREVFRRAAGHRVLAAELRRQSGIEAPRPDDADAAPSGTGPWRWLAAAAVLGFVAALVAWFLLR